MFEIGRSTELFTIWMPVNNGQTLYIGQLATSNYSNDDYLVSFPTPSGAATAKPLGVVVGVNNKVAVYSPTYRANYISGVGTQALQLARQWQAAQGCMWGVGDPIPLAQIAYVGPETSVKGRIYSGTFGTSLSTFSPATGSSDGTTIMVVEGAISSIANQTTFYCRSGRNKGLYRVCSNASYSGGATTNTFATPWPYPIATSDVFVKANLRQGISKIYINTGLFIDGANMLANYYTVLVEEINLAETGKEYAIIRFV